MPKRFSELSRTQRYRKRKKKEIRTAESSDDGEREVSSDSGNFNKKIMK